MNDWDAESIRNGFASTAQLAENYFNELAGRIKRDPKGQSDYVRELHDEHLAKWFVYDSFAFSSHLESRGTFVAEAKARLATRTDFCATGSFKKENFQKYWRHYLGSLIKQYDK